MREKGGLFRRVWNTPYGFTTPFKLYDASKSSKVFVQKLRLEVKLPVHDGCVNTICWNESGEYILSGSDDQHLCITHGYKHSILTSVQTGHRANIFSAKFLPNTADEQVISCSGDGAIIYSNLTQPETSTNNIFNCHFGTAYEIMTIPNDPHTFLSCGEDGTVRWFDLRAKTCCSTEDCKEDILINCRCAVTSLAVNPLTPYQLGVGCADASVRIFDCRVLGTRSSGNYLGSSVQAMISHFTVPEFQGLGHRITSLSYSPDGKEMLVSYSSDYIYLFEVNDNCNKESKVLEAFLPGKTFYKEGKNKSLSSRPRLKRLRVRGDWSDTGPNARPEVELRGAEENSSRSKAPSNHSSSAETSFSPIVEAEQEQRHRVLRASLVRRMSDALKRMLNRSSRGQQRYGNLSTSSSSISASPSGSDGESSEDENRETANIARETQETNEICLNDIIEEVSRENYFTHEPLIDESAEDLTTNETDSSNLQAESRVEKPVVVSEPENSNEINYNNSYKNEESSRTSVEFLEKEFAHPTSQEESMTLEGSDADDDQPGSEVLNLSLQSLEHELSSRRKDLIEKHNIEPVVSLHFSGQGVNSGLITVDVASTSQQQWQNLNTVHSHAPEDQTDVPGLPDIPVEEHSRSAPLGDTLFNSTSSSSCDKQPSGITCDVQNNFATPTDSCDSALNLTSDHETKLEYSHSFSEESENFSQQNQQEFCWMFSESNEQNSAQRELGEESQSERASRNESSIRESEPPLLMDMGNWNVDSSSDDEHASQSHMSEQSVQCKTSSGNIPDRILRSVDDGIKWRQEEREHEKAQMMKVPQPGVKRKFTGHRNARTMIKEATFWGNNFIMSGSDCGHIFIWDRFTSELVMIMEADHHVVNCLQPHPFDPILASSGIDYDIKLWAPLREEPFFDRKKVKEIMERNEIMLEETKDTITVPASFMIRMLASLNTLRSSGRRQRNMIYLDHEDD